MVQVNVNCLTEKEAVKETESLILLVIYAKAILLYYSSLFTIPMIVIEAEVYRTFVKLIITYLWLTL